MIVSIGLILAGAILAFIMMEVVKLPKMIGFLLVGILLGPFVLDWLDPAILENGAAIRKLALVIILIKAGLTIRLADLKEIGRPAIFMSFLPALMEMLAYTVFAPFFFSISPTEAALMGSVLAAVSPAVVVPRMVELIDQKIGTSRKMPQLILAGASLDDVVVILLFTSLLGLVATGKVEWIHLLHIPISIVLSIVLGFIIGKIVGRVLKKWHLKQTIPAIYAFLLVLAVACFLVQVEEVAKPYVALSALLSILMIAIQLPNTLPSDLSTSMANFYSKIWLVAEIFLFVLLGSLVDIHHAISAGLAAVGLITLTLLVRTIGVWLSLVGSGFSLKEKVFCVIAYLPKATVQAAIGGIPLSMGLASGEIILSVALIGILITAPLGAILLDRYAKLLLSES
ncbi:cation:proton antiporter domain-containing protein [Streptococcus cameli]